MVRRTHTKAPSVLADRQTERQCPCRAVQPHVAGGVFGQRGADSRGIQCRPQSIPAVVQREASPLRAGTEDAQTEITRMRPRY